MDSFETESDGDQWGYGYALENSDIHPWVSIADTELEVIFKNLLIEVALVPQALLGLQKHGNQI